MDKRVLQQRDAHYHWYCSQIYHLIHQLLPKVYLTGENLEWGGQQNGILVGYVLQRQAFTDIFCVRPRIMSHLTWLRDDVIELKLYHDVCCAEITGIQGELRQPATVAENWHAIKFNRSLDFNQKWQLNLLLFETLIYLKSYKT